MEKRLLATEAEVHLYKMLVWGAAGVMGAAALTTRVAWARARNICTICQQRTIVALTNNVKTQAKIETARSACLEWQIASIKNREKISLINEELAREKKGLASAQAQVQTARSACLEWQMASIKSREKLSLANEELAREKKKTALAQAQVQMEQSERLELQMAYVQLREQHSEEFKALQQEVGDFSLVTGAMVPLAFQALEANRGENKLQIQTWLPRQ